MALNSKDFFNRKSQTAGILAVSFLALLLLACFLSLGLNLERRVRVVIGDRILSARLADTPWQEYKSLVKGRYDLIFVLGNRVAAVTPAASQKAAGSGPYALAPKAQGQVKVLELKPSYGAVRNIKVGDQVKIYD